MECVCVGAMAGRPRISPVHVLGAALVPRASSSATIEIGLRSGAKKRRAMTAAGGRPLQSLSMAAESRLVRCVAEDAPTDPQEAPPATAEPTAESTAEPTAKPTAKPTPKAAALPKKPKFSMSKGQIVRVDKEKYLNSIEYYAVAHPKFYKGIDYIYEDRGEILDLRNFEAGEYALITWAGIPTSPAWLPTSMLIKSDKLSYKRV